jgi:hypothetical protein
MSETKRGREGEREREREKERDKPPSKIIATGLSGLECKPRIFRPAFRTFDSLGPRPNGLLYEAK